MTITETAPARAQDDLPDPIDIHVGAQLRARRLQVGMTQHVLAVALGVSFQQVQKYETGANRVSASRMWNCAEVLGVEVGFFYEGLESAPKSFDLADFRAREAYEQRRRRGGLRAWEDLDPADPFDMALGAVARGLTQA